MSIGSRIKEQRSKHGLTQPELALKLEMSLDSIKKLETDRVKPSIETLVKMCDLFNVSADYLLSRDVESIEFKKAKLRKIVDIANQYKQFLLENNDLPPMEFMRNYLATIREYDFEKNPQPWIPPSDNPMDHIKFILQLTKEEFEKLSEEEKQNK